MKIALLLLLVIFFIAGLIGIVLGLPGTFIIWAGILIYAALTGFKVLGLKLLIGLFVIALLAELSDNLLGILGARRYGSSKWGIIGSIIGGIAGALVGSSLLPIIGSVIGALIGVFMGALFLEWAVKKNFQTAWRAAIGALGGRIVAVALKLILALVMMIIVFITIF